MPLVPFLQANIVAAIDNAARLDRDWLSPGMSGYRKYPTLQRTERQEHRPLHAQCWLSLRVWVKIQSQTSQRGCSGNILSARCRTSVTYAPSASTSDQANVSDGMILVVCGERWIGRREMQRLAD